MRHIALNLLWQSVFRTKDRGREGVDVVEVANSVWIFIRIEER